MSLEGARAWPLRGQRPDAVFLSTWEGGPVISLVSWMLSSGVFESGARDPKKQVTLKLSSGGDIGG